MSGRSTPGLEGVRSIPWSEADAETLDHAREVEAAWALETLWSIAGDTNTLEAEWEFLFWSQDGALTLLSFRRTEQGEKPAAPLGRGAFLPRLGRELPTLLGTHPHEVTLTLERQETGWSADLDSSSGKKLPLHARMIPSTRTGTSAQTHQQVLETARSIARVMVVPRGGRAELAARVLLDDARIESWELADLDSSGNGPALAGGKDAVHLLVTALLPFTRGMGERTVTLSLEGMHRHGEAHPRWRVTAARVLEPTSLPAEIADIHLEYRMLHEHILTEFQKQTREYAVLVAGFTLEQIAYSLVGGLALKGTWVLIGKGAPTVLAFLSKGGKGAVLWFRNLLLRAPAADRELLLRLWTKAETQGLKALTEVEKREFQALMVRLEKVLGTPVDNDAKRQLWKWSREVYFGLYNPRLAKILGEKGMSMYQVHHHVPIRYTHHFPKLDINGKANLAGLHEDVHQSINGIWASLGGVSQRMKPSDIMRVVEIINRHYGRWFDKIHDPRDAPALAKAAQAALAEVTQLKALLTP